MVWWFGAMRRCRRIGQQGLARAEAAQHGGGAAAGLAFREGQADGQSVRVDEGMDLGRPSAARAADCLIELPPLPPDAER